jgi:hypothetical protein
MVDCPRFGKWFGCRFEPRYDEPPLLSHIFGDGMFSSIKIDGKMQTIEDLIPMKKYIRDVCVRCGKVVERQK